MTNLFPLDAFVGLLFIAGGIAVISEVDKAPDMIIMLMLFMIAMVYHKRSKVILERLEEDEV